MPSIIPGYLYSLFAALIVGAIVVYSCGMATLSIKTDAENQQLINIDQYVAAQSLILLSRTAENQNSTQYLDIPTQIGSQRFWIRIANDSRGAWVESGFGTTINPTDMRIDMPAKAYTSGSFISGSGRPLLMCRFENQTPILTLTTGE
jgi:hypothetical protein